MFNQSSIHIVPVICSNRSIEIILICICNCGCEILMICKYYLFIAHSTGIYLTLDFLKCSIKLLLLLLCICQICKCYFGDWRARSPICIASRQTDKLGMRIDNRSYCPVINIVSRKAKFRYIYTRLPCLDSFNNKLLKCCCIICRCQWSRTILLLNDNAKSAFLQSVVQIIIPYRNLTLIWTYPCLIRCICSHFTAWQ